MSGIELNEKSAIDLLKRYIDIGYKTGSLSIKEGAIVNKYLRVLKGLDTDDSSVSKVDMYNTLFKVINHFNTNKAYSLDDASVISRLFSFYEENQTKVIDTPETPKDL